MKRVASLWQEFKAFAFKGNMIDLAVAVVIGGAFSGVINSLVKDIIIPSITYVTTAAAEAGSKAADVAKSTASAVGVTSKPAETQPAATQPAAAAAAASEPAPVPAVPLSPEMQQLKDMLASIKNAPAPAPPPADAKPVDISWTIGRIKIGNFIGELINFVLIAAAVFIVIVKLLGSVMKRMSPSTPTEGPTTKECPYCLSVIPIKATKCGHCTADLVAAKPA
jgi:large conductance mechanosensitive channel